MDDVKNISKCGFYLAQGSRCANRPDTTGNVYWAIIAFKTHSTSRLIRDQHHEAEAVRGEEPRRIARVVEQDALERVDRAVRPTRHGNEVIRLKARQSLFKPLLEQHVRIDHAQHIVVGQRSALVWLIAEQQPLDVRKGNRKVYRLALDVGQGTRQFEHSVGDHHVA